jgi:hypothetical protein
MLAPIIQWKPSLQLPDGLVRPVPLQNLPGSHCEHWPTDCRLVMLPYVPAGQSVADGDAVPLRQYAPRGQFSGAVLLSGQ